MLLLRATVAYLGLAGVVAAASWPANDESRVRRTGRWEWTSHRYAAESALVTNEDGASLECSTRGRALVLELDTLTPPNYRGPDLGALEVFVDGQRGQTVRPRSEDREVLLWRSASVEKHQVRIVQRTDAGAGVRVRGFRELDEPTGDLAFLVSGEHNDALIDLRAVLSHAGRVVRDGLVRNWLTGQCRLVGLAPADDYVLELRAAGWRSARVEKIAVRTGEETVLAPVYLQREDGDASDFKFPSLGHPVVLLPGGELRARFEANRAEIRGARLVRAVGPATISRHARFTEDKAAAFYYHREGRVETAADTPPGVYDLEVAITDNRGQRTLTSPRSVVVVERFSQDPVLFAFGHLDTWGQNQAEYLARLVEVANIVAPDLVLVSNEANAAYAAGALYGLRVPFIVNFGNHAVPEPGPWFGQPIGIVDFGREFTVLNFGRAWDTDLTEADHLLSARSDVPIRIINAFESNAPLAGFLDKHRIPLIHYAHGPGPAVAAMGATPTVRVGKVNSESFRVIRFRAGRPVTYTYRGHATAPLPFPRRGQAPIRVSYQPANDGQARKIAARVTNDLEEAFPRARVDLVVAPGAYRVSGGTIAREVASDDGRHVVVSIRFDLRPNSVDEIRLEPK